MFRWENFFLDLIIEDQLKLSKRKCKLHNKVQKYNGHCTNILWIRKGETKDTELMPRKYVDEVKNKAVMI